MRKNQIDLSNYPQSSIISLSRNSLDGEKETISCVPVLALSKADQAKFIEAMRLDGDPASMSAFCALNDRLEDKNCVFAQFSLEDEEALRKLIPADSGNIAQEFQELKSIFDNIQSVTQNFEAFKKIEVSSHQLDLLKKFLTEKNHVALSAKLLAGQRYQINNFLRNSDKVMAHQARQQTQPERFFRGCNSSMTDLSIFSRKPNDQAYPQFIWSWIILDGDNKILGFLEIYRETDKIRKIQEHISQDFPENAIFRGLYLIKDARRKGLSTLIFNNITKFALGERVFLTVSQYNDANHKSLSKLHFDPAPGYIPAHEIYANMRLYPVPHEGYTAYPNATDIAKSEESHRKLIEAEFARCSNPQFFRSAFELANSETECRQLIESEFASQKILNRLLEDSNQPRRC